MMELVNFHRLRGSVKVLSAVLGASVVVTMGAMTVAYQRNEVSASTASENAWTAATVTRSPSPAAPQTSFAAPPFLNGPCPKRAVYPCSR
jgi:hypothetical protein